VHAFRVSICPVAQGHLPSHHPAPCHVSATRWGAAPEYCTWHWSWLCWASAWWDRKHSRVMEKWVLGMKLVVLSVLWQQPEGGSCPLCCMAMSLISLNLYVRTCAIHDHLFLYRYFQPFIHASHKFGLVALFFPFYYCVAYSLFSRSSVIEVDCSCFMETNLFNHSVYVVLAKSVFI
jgi:hypothetical protein